MPSIVPLPLAKGVLQAKLPSPQVLVKLGCRLNFVLYFYKALESKIDSARLAKKLIFCFTSSLESVLLV